MANATSAVLAALGSSAWSPSQLGLKQWYDFKDPTKSYDSQVGGSLVVTNGANIKRIDDKAGLFPLTEAGGPTLLTGGINGHRCANFAGNSYLASTLDALIDRSNFLIAMVVTQNSYKANQGYIVFGANGANNDFGATGLTVEQGGSGADNIGGNTPGGGAFGSMGGIGIPVSVIVRVSGASMNVWVGGIEVAANGAMGGPWGNAGPGFGIANRYLGAWNGSTYRADIRIGEVFVATAGVLSDIPKIHAYFKEKFTLVDWHAQDFINRRETADSLAMSSPNKLNVDKTVVALKTKTLWTKIPEIYLYSGAHTLTGSLIKLKGHLGALASTGFVSGDYSRTAGLTGDGATKYLDSNVLTSAVFGAQSQMIFVTGTGFNTAAPDECLMGVFDGVSGTSLLSLDAYAGYVSGRVFRSGTGTLGDMPIITSGLTASGSITGVKESSTYAAIYQNGVLVNSNTNFVSSSPTNRNMFPFCLNYNGTPASHAAVTKTTEAWGPKLTATEVLDLHTIMTDYAAGVT